MNSCVSADELALFVADPLLEEKRGLTEVIICRLCGLPFEKLPQHLIAKHSDELQTTEMQISDAQGDRRLVKEYRRRFGYNKRAPLCSYRLCRVLSGIRKRINAVLRHKGKRVPLHGFRKGRAPIEAARKARVS